MRGDPVGESSVVNVLVGEGLAIVQAVAKANLNQPRYAATREPTGVARGRRVSAETTKTNAVGEATAEGTRSVRRGPGDGMHEQTDNLKWGPTLRRSVPRTKNISRGMAVSGSDEAIVSDDLAGQHNRPASQGPLGGIARGTSSDYLPLGATGRWRTWLSWRISRVVAAKVVMEFPLEAVLGKTRRTEF